jgi:hypothetical protein
VASENGAVIKPLLQNVNAKGSCGIKRYNLEMVTSLNTLVTPKTPYRDKKDSSGRKRVSWLNIEIIMTDRRHRLQRRRPGRQELR